MVTYRIPTFSSRIPVHPPLLSQQSLLFDWDTHVSSNLTSNTSFASWSEGTPYTSWLWSSTTRCSLASRYNSPSASYQANLVKDILRTTILPTNLLLVNFLLIPGHLLSIFSQSLYLSARGLVSPEVLQWHLKDISSLRSVHTPSIKKRSEKDWVKLD